MSSIAGLLLWRKGWWLAGLLGLAGVSSWLTADAAEAPRPKAAPIVAAAEQVIVPEEAPSGNEASDPIWLRTSREAEAAAQAAPPRLPAQRQPVPHAAAQGAYGKPPAAVAAPVSSRRVAGRLPSILGPSGQSESAAAPADPQAPAPLAPAPFTPGNFAPANSAPRNIASVPREMNRLPAVEEEAAAPQALPAATHIGAAEQQAAQPIGTSRPLNGFSRGETIAAAPVTPIAEAPPAFEPAAAVAPAFTPAPLAAPAAPAPMVGGALAGFSRGEAVTTPARVAEPAADKPAAIQALLDRPVIAPAKPAQSEVPRVTRPKTQSERMATPGNDYGVAPVIDPDTARKLLGQNTTIQVSATSDAAGGPQSALFRTRTPGPGEAHEVRPLSEPATLDRGTPVASGNPIRASRGNGFRVAQVQPPAADPFGDDPLPPRAGPAAPGGDPMLEVTEQPFEEIDATGTLEVMLRRSLLLRTKADIYRTAVVDPTICDVVQFTPREVSIIGKGQGATSVTFWFNDGRHRPITYVVRVRADIEERRRLEGQYKLLQDILREQFPNSKVYLIPVADKLIVKGQARDGEEAAQIMAIIRGQTSSALNRGQYYNLVAQGNAAQVLGQNETGRAAMPRMQVINMLRVPGVQQVSLRTKIAELSRSAARGFGVNVQADIDFSGSSSLLLNSMLNATTGSAPALLASFDGDDVQIGVRYLQQRGVIRVLSEPTLVTMSGTSATFVAGGEFAVPTIVGSAGLNAVTTDFRAFGVLLSFTPTVLDKDRIRLQVAPEFSAINGGNSVNGIPGLNVRAVTTTVEMREGQTLAIAGLLDDSMKSSNIGDLPFLAEIFGRRDVSRNETELIILVSPELIHPMEPEEVPPLPGFDVTEPDNWDFFIRGKIEGKPTMEYRSTVWPRLRDRYRGGGTGMVSGPFGHGN